MHDAIVIDPCGAVHQMDGQRFCQRHCTTGPLPERRLDTVPGPAPAQDVFSQFGGFFEAYTSMTEGALGLGKQRARWGIMQVHLEPIGQEKVDVTQGGLWTRFLT